MAYVERIYAVVDRKGLRICTSPDMKNKLKATYGKLFKIIEQINKYVFRI